MKNETMNQNVHSFIFLPCPKFYISLLYNLKYNYVWTGSTDVSLTCTYLFRIIYNAEIVRSVISVEDLKTIGKSSLMIL